MMWNIILYVIRKLQRLVLRKPRNIWFSRLGVSLCVIACRESVRVRKIALISRVTTLRGSCRGVMTSCPWPHGGQGRTLTCLHLHTLTMCLVFCLFFYLDKIHFSKLDVCLEGPKTNAQKFLLTYVVRSVKEIKYKYFVIYLYVLHRIVWLNNALLILYKV